MSYLLLHNRLPRNWVTWTISIYIIAHSFSRPGIQEWLSKTGSGFCEVPVKELDKVQEMVNLDWLNQSFSGDFMIFQILHVIWHSPHLFLIYKWSKTLSPWRNAEPRPDLGLFLFLRSLILHNTQKIKPWEMPMRANIYNEIYNSIKTF